MFVGYSLIESELDLHRFFSFNTVLILIVNLLGIAQSIIGPKFLNPAVLQEDIRELVICIALLRFLVWCVPPHLVFCERRRYSNFLIVCCSWLSLCRVLALTKSSRAQFAFICVAVIGVGTLMNASRGVFMWTAGNAMVVTAAFLWGAPWRQGEARRVLRIIQRSLLVVGVAVLVMMTFFPDQVASRLAIYDETLSLDSPASELIHRTVIIRSRIS